MAKESKYVAFNFAINAFVIKANDYSKESPFRGPGLEPIFEGNCGRYVILGELTEEGFKPVRYTLGETTSRMKFGSSPDVMSPQHLAQIVAELKNCKAEDRLSKPEIVNGQTLRAVFNPQGQRVRFLAQPDDLDGGEVELTPENLTEILSLKSERTPKPAGTGAVLGGG